jgi:hypothetical protein
MTKAPMTKTANGASRGLRRFQFIEPIASPKTLVIVAGRQTVRVAGLLWPVVFPWTKKSPERKLSGRDIAAVIGAGYVAMDSAEAIFTNRL